MKIKNYYWLFLFLLFLNILTVTAQNDRFSQIKLQLESYTADMPGLTERVDLNVNNSTLSDFLQALSISHKVNLTIAPELNQIIIKNNFTNVTVNDVLLFVCKEYALTIDFTGSIFSIRKYTTPYTQKKQRTIPIAYNENNNTISLDLQNDTLYVAFKQIIDKTGKNLVYAPGLDRQLLIGYIQNMPFDSALDKIAFSNNLTVTKTRDNYYLFERVEGNTIEQNNSSNNQKVTIQKPLKQRRSNFFFEINDSTSKSLNVDFENTPIANIVYDIGNELKKNMFTASPLSEAGTATVKADGISFDFLLDKILGNTEFTYKKQDSIYFFGKKDQQSLRDAVVIPMMYRSIEIMNGGEGFGRKAGRTSYNAQSNFTGNNTVNNLTTNNQNNSANRQNINTSRTDAFSVRENQLESLISMIPEDVVKDLKVSIDVELNSFIVSGPSQHIERFKKFIEIIDKPVPVILIEVMLIEVNRTASVKTGVKWGIGENAVTTKGNLFPTTDITLGANTINRIIGGFSDFGTLNIGQVIPNFYAEIKALETNGNIKIRSAPKLSALNGHRANLSIGETTYYAVTQRDIIGSQNPQTSTITNYVPIDAEFAINIKPIVSGDGQITLEINVIQSNFNGKKVAVDAPPGLNSREFNSIIRVKNQDLVILGGLEEKIMNDTGTGVPFLARIPVIKWLFSQKEREDSKKKLTVLIKPTIIN